MGIYGTRRGDAVERAALAHGSIRVNIEIMRTFDRLPRLIATPGELVKQLKMLAETVQLHGDQIKTITRVLQRMFEQPEKPRRRIGFQHDSKDD